MLAIDSSIDNERVARPTGARPLLVSVQVRHPIVRLSEWTRNSLALFTPHLREHRLMAGNSTDPGRSVTSKVTAISWHSATVPPLTLTEIAGIA